VDRIICATPRQGKEEKLLQFSAKEKIDTASLSGNFLES
jgi:hypothetical protein